ncbi:hypothetical protein MNO11_15780 [Serratia plymuthica]|uniref:hypothetical protein n=1 Tax=Serratia plymuthica TaxID=82996 RepID=UPI001F52D0D1|nr:hypothetical protein [Serratia plymuthica]UNK26306.1 hypothetical protein MNO11_15780 [Serratia plymuthica]
MVINTELENILIEKGGLYESDEELELFLGPLRNRLLRHCEIAKQYVYTNSNRRIEFDFISNFSVNAFAYASPPGENEFDFIGINIGSCVMLLNILNRIFSHPNAFPDWGDVRQEQIDYELLRGLTFDDVVGPVIVPKNPTRHAIANMLYGACMDFLFFHEMSHLRNGHLEWLRSTGTMNHFAEVESNGCSSSYALERQALEMDADCGAMLFSFNNALEIHSGRLPKLEEQKSLPQAAIEALNILYGTPARCAETTAIASYIFFRIFDKSDWNMFKPSLLTHPEIPLRMHWSITLLQELLNTNVESNLGICNLNSLANVIPNIEQAYGLIQGTAPDPRGILSVTGDSLNLNIAHLVAVKAAWTSLHPLLEPNVRGGKLAPP